MSAPVMSIIATVPGGWDMDGVEPQPTFVRAECLCGWTFQEFAGMECRTDPPASKESVGAWNVVEPKADAHVQAVHSGGGR